MDVDNKGVKNSVFSENYANDRCLCTVLEVVELRGIVRLLYDVRVSSFGIMPV